MWCDDRHREDVCEPSERLGYQLVGPQLMFHQRHEYGEQSQQADPRPAGHEQVPYHAAGPSLPHHPQESHFICQKVSSSFIIF